MFSSSSHSGVLGEVPPDQAAPEETGSESSSGWSLFSGSVSNQALVRFTRNFAVMMGAKLPLVDALETARAQTDNDRLASVLKKVAQAVRGGASLSASLGEHSSVFGRLYVHLVRVGEKAGILDETLRQLAKYLQRRHELRRKVRLAFVYPGLVLTVALGATIFLLAVIVPTFAELFAEFDAELPQATQIVLEISRAITSNYLLLSGGAVALGLGSRAFLRTETGSYVWDTIQIKTPLLGTLYLKGIVARTCRTLGTLLDNGVPLDEALQVQIEAAENVHLQEAFEAMSRAVRRGDPLAVPAERAGLFPEMIVQMIRVGEQTAQLGPMLREAADHYEAEVQDTADTLASILEPVLIVFIGALLGSILVALYLPMFDLMNVVR
jgi:type IV pilus assembly protein PilC